MSCCISGAANFYCYFLFFGSECPIKGQIRKDCASHITCHHTCNNLDENRPCLAVCIINGCECPDGTVIDVDKGECVAPNECPVDPSGMYVINEK